MFDFIKKFDFVYPWNKLEEGEVEVDLQMEGKYGNTAVVDTYMAQYLIEEKDGEKRAFLTNRMGRYEEVDAGNLRKLLDQNEA